MMDGVDYMDPASGFLCGQEHIHLCTAPVFYALCCNTNRSRRGYSPSNAVVSLEQYSLHISSSSPLQVTDGPVLLAAAVICFWRPSHELRMHQCISSEDLDALCPCGCCMAISRQAPHHFQICLFPLHMSTRQMSSTGPYFLANMIDQK